LIEKPEMTLQSPEIILKIVPCIGYTSLRTHIVESIAFIQEEYLMLMRTRPLGVTIIAILVAIGGILEIIGGILLLSSPFFGLFTIILGVLALILAWGLWTLQSWAFWATIILEVISAIENLVSLIRGNGGSVIGLIVAVVIIAYMLYDRNVRAAFRT